MFRFEDHRRLRAANPPLARVIADIRFPIIASLSHLAGVESLQQALAAEFPVMEQGLVQSTAITVTIGSAPSTEVRQDARWIFRSEQGYELTVTPNAAVLSIGPDYRSREQFEVVLRFVSDALIAAKGVSRSDRVGVRYINTIFDEAMRWREWFKPEIVGWVAHDFVDVPSRLSMATTILSDATIRSNETVIGNVTASIRHGYVPVGPDISAAGTGPAFVLDIDVATDAPRPMSTKDIATIFTAFNHEIAAFFTYSLTDSGAEHFGVTLGEEP